MKSSSPEITGRSEAYKRILSVLGISLSMAGSSCKEGHASLLERRPASQIIIDEARAGIYDTFPPKSEREPAPKKLETGQIKRAVTTRNEMGYGEVSTLAEHGGYFFSLRRLPEMKKENPKALGKVYMRFPEEQKGNPRALVFFHGNGEQGYRFASEKNVMRITQDMQDHGDEVILIMPEDGWGNFKPEGREKDKPGNWQDFNNPQTLSNLIEFAERMYGEHIQNITLASFSGGNLGIKKSLRALEKAKGDDPEMASLYQRISQIAYFDSATGSEREYIARWMASHPDARLWSAFNYGSIYKNGNELLLDSLEKEGVDPKRFHWERMKWNEGHGVYEEYFRRFTAPQEN